MNILKALTLTLVLLLSACGNATKLMVVADKTPIAGKPISIEQIDSYSRFTLRFLFWLQNAPKALSVDHGIAMYRLVYWTHAADGRIVRASGLLSLPVGEVPKAAVSWQHGTTSLRSAAPSDGDLFNGLFPAAVFAGRGYLLLAPDYHGFGASEEPHSYYNRKEIAGTIRDFVTASKAALIQNDKQWPDVLLLSGFSQGAHAALAAQQLIESEGSKLTVTASAPVAAAIDLKVEGLRGALAGKSRFSSLYLGWIALTYSRDYNLPLDSLVALDWIDTVSTVFDGFHDGETIIESLPVDPKQLMHADVIRAVDENGGHPFLDMLEKNSLLGYEPKAPVRIYYGEADVDVTPAQAKLFGGENVEIMNLGPLDHENSIVAAIPLVLEWFDSLVVDQYPAN